MIGRDAFAQICAVVTAMVPVLAGVELGIGALFRGRSGQAGGEADIIGRFHSEYSCDQKGGGHMYQPWWPVYRCIPAYAVPYDGLKGAPFLPISDCPNALLRFRLPFRGRVGAGASGIGTGHASARGV